MSPVRTSWKCLLRPRVARAQGSSQLPPLPFFSILRERSRVTGLMPGCPFVGECHGGIPFAKYFRNSVHQFGDLLDVLRGKILSKSRVQPPPSFHFFSGDGRHHAHQLDLGSRRTLGPRCRGRCGGADVGGRRGRGCVNRGDWGGVSSQDCGDGRNHGTRTERCGGGYLCVSCRCPSRRRLVRQSFSTSRPSRDCLR